MDSRSAVGQGDGVGGHVMRRGTPAASVMTSSDNAPTRRARRVHRGSALVQCMSEPPTSGAFWVPGPRGPRRPNGMDTLIIQNRPLPVDAPPHWGACPAVANPPTSEKKKVLREKIEINERGPTSGHVPGNVQGIRGVVGGRKRDDGGHPGREALNTFNNTWGWSSRGTGGSGGARADHWAIPTCLAPRDIGCLILS